MTTNDDDPDDESDGFSSLQLGPGADAPAEVANSIDGPLRGLYEVYSYRHAASVLRGSHSEELADVAAALMQFRLSVADITAPGGNESGIVKRVTALLRTAGWKEARVHADLVVTKTTKEKVPVVSKRGTLTSKTVKDVDTSTIERFVDGHKIDFVKNRVAFDMEWNSKDQTFDRDLYAFRAFYECNVISAGIILTRSQKLNDVFKAHGVMHKYGASTTWMGKLLYRLNAGRNGGCPVLIFGISPKLVEDWTE